MHFIEYSPISFLFASSCELAEKLKED